MTPPKTSAAISPIAPVRTAVHEASRPAAVLRRATAMVTPATARPSATAKKPTKTPRTSRMCACSRGSRTGAPATATSKSGGPMTRSARTESVTCRSVASSKPVHAAASARPCSNATHHGLRKSGIATARITTAVERASTNDPSRPLTVSIPASSHARGTDVRRTPERRPRSLLLERPGLLPPAVHRQLVGRVDAELPGRPPKPFPEALGIERKDVAQPLDPRLDEQLVLVGTEAREVEHQRLVAPHQDVVGGRGDLVGEDLATGRRFGPFEQQPGRERALMLEAREMDRFDAGQLVDRRHARIIEESRPGRQASSAFPFLGSRSPSRTARPNAWRATSSSGGLISPARGARNARSIPPPRKPGPPAIRRASSVALTPAGVAASLASGASPPSRDASQPAAVARTTWRAARSSASSRPSRSWIVGRSATAWLPSPGRRARAHRATSARAPSPTPRYVPARASANQVPAVGSRVAPATGA